MDNKNLVRDCLNKLYKISDDSWEDIIERYELNYSSDHIRKMAYGMKLLDETLEYSLDKESEVSFLNEKILELKKEKVKLTDLKTLTNQRIRDLARKEEMIELLEKQISNLSPKKFLNQHIYEADKSKEAILCLGDIHYGLICNNSVNKYDTQTSIERLEAIIDKAIDKCTLHNINELNVALLGDLISGEIHSTIRLQNRENLISQMINIAEILSEVLMKLASNIPIVKVSMVQGNHERIYPQKDNLNEDNYTNIIKEFIRIRVQSKSNILFNTTNFNDEEISHFNILGNEVLICHGDKLNKEKCAEQLYLMTGIKPDIAILGHFHNPMNFTIGNANIFVNGALIGSDEYAINKKLYTPPSQTLLIVNKEGVECSYILKAEGEKQ